LIETKIIETDLNTNENMGIDWILQASANGAQLPTIFPFAQSKGGQVGQIGGTSFYPTSTSTLSTASAPALTTTTIPGFTYGTINATQFSATLNILSTRENIHVLSDPRIVTLDNQKAKIVVAEEYPEATYSFNSSTGQQQVTGFTTLPIGINFEVTPHVNNAGMVTLELHPQISAFNKTITVDNNQLPDTNNQEAETNVMVEDGKTLVIGGLITDTKTVTKTKIPLLGDIPWLGPMLFSSSSTTKARREIIIFLTPHIITIGKSSAMAAVR
jgi:type II secretory pathway component GspD/PulD (secretin)